ncbi:MAG: hypothetical protein KAX11_07675 [Candidatus Aminicenantes bacterium]|nr:hypothetical protein [Candidatus Aminicenantes bacterium]
MRKISFILIIILIGIIPHHIVKTSIENFKNNKDSVLDYTLKLIDNLPSLFKSSTDNLEMIN